MKYQAIIFDLDGVICHTDQYHYKAWKKLADSLGIYFDETVNNRLRGVGRAESFDIILERYEGEMSPEDKNQYMKQKNEQYLELLKEMSPADLTEEVKTTLDTLKEKGYKLAIGSSSKNAKFILRQIGLADYFDGISDGTNISRPKPDPEVFLKAAELVGAEPGKCLVVEDAEAGLIASKAGGMDCAGIGEARDSELADYKLQRFSGLLALDL